MTCLNSSLFSSELDAAIDFQPLIVTPEMSLKEAIAKMGQSQVASIQNRSEPALAVHYALVIADSQLVGLLTQTDMIRWISEGGHLEQTRVDQVMSREFAKLYYANLHTFDPVLELLERGDIPAIPILDDSEGLIGTITPSKLIRTLQTQVDQQQKAIANWEAHLNQSPAWAVSPTALASLSTDRLFQQAEAFNTLLNATSSLGLILTTQGRIINFNQACSETLHYSLSDLQDQPFWDVLFLPEDRRSVKTIFDRLQAGHFPQQHEHYWLTKEGDRRFIVWSSSLLGDPAHPSGYLIINGIDITERRLTEITLSYLKDQLEYRLQDQTVKLQREIEERQRVETTLRKELNFLARIVESSPLGITLVNAHGQISFASERAEQILGLNRLDIQQRSYNAPEWKITDYNGQPLTDEELPFQQVLRTGKAVYDVQHAIQWPDGHRILLSINGAPLFDQTGALEGVVFAIADITDRVQAEQELRQTKEQLEVILEGIADGIHVLNASGQLIYANQAAAQAYGYPSAEMLIQNSRNQNVLEQFAIFDESGQPLSLSELPGRLALQGIQSPQREICYQLSSTGIERYAILKATPIFDELNQVRLVVIVTHDITERKQAEAALRESEECYRQIVETASEGIWIINPSYLTTFVNQKMAEMLGYGVEEVIGRSILEFMDEQGRAIALAKLQRSSPDISAQHDLKLRCRDGSDLWVIISTTPTFDAKDRYLGSLGMMTDITERKRAEEALQESEERFRAVFDQAGMGMAICTLDGRFFRVNQRLCEILGYSRIELLDLTFREITEPEYLPRNLEWVEALIADEISSFSLEKQYIRKDGTSVWVNVITSLVREPTGEPKYFIGAVKDISDRKQAESALRQSEVSLRALLNAVPESAFLMDTQGIVIEANETVSQRLGTTPEQLVGHCIYDCLPPEVAQSRKEYALEVIRTGQPVRFEDLRTNRWVDSTIYPIKNTAGTVIRLAVFGLDLTERKQAEQALLLAQERLKYLLTSSPAVIYSCNPCLEDTGANFVSENVKALSGYEAENFVNDRNFWVDRIHPDDREAVFMKLSTLLAEDHNTYEYRFLHQEGSYRWLQDSVKVIRDEVGNPLELVGYWVDVTERKQTEAALQESQRFIQQIADFNPSILYIYDFIEHKSVYINGAIAEILGYSPAEVQEMGGIILQNLMHPEDFAQVISVRYPHFLEIGDDEIIENEYRMRHRDGTWRWLYSREVVFKRTSDHHPQQILGSATDITERKQAEEALQTANQQLIHWVTELENRNRDMALLSEMSDFLQSCFTVKEACAAIAPLVEPLFPGSSGGMFILEATSNVVEAVATWGEALSSELLFTPHDCWALRRGRLHNVQVPKAGLFCKHISRDPLPAETLCIPMMAQGDTLGLLYLSFSVSHQLSEAKQQLARTVAEHLALALANLRLRETLQSQSIRDALTGLFNRRYLEEALKREIHCANREGTPLGMIMMDVDRFKQFNDRFGHEAGDLVLRKIGSFLLQNIRASDIACRYGGEEMTIILPKADLEATYQRAEQLRQGIKSLQIQYGNQVLDTITISLGVACFPEQGIAGESVLQAADAALYQAKAAGRDRVWVADSTP